ncbi:MAG: stage III sporulation protein AE [Acetanaerobacterium sp.]
MLKRISVMLVIAFLLAVPVCAEESDYESVLPDGMLEEQIDASGADELWSILPDRTREYLASIGIEDVSIGAILSLEPGEFFGLIGVMLRDTISKPQIIFFSVLGIILLCSLIDGFKEGFLQKSLGGVFSTVAVLCIAGAVITPVMNCIQKAARAVYDCSNFMLAFVPVLSGVMAVSGQPGTASAYNLLLFGAAEITAQVASSTVVPLLGIYLAFCIVSSVTPQINLSGAAQLVKSCASWVLGFIITVFVALLSVQTMVTSGVDNVAVRAGKFIIGSFIPVVGGALADAMTSVGGCLMLLKSVIGVFGIIAAAVIFLPILLEALVWMITLKAAAAVSDIFELKQVSEVLKGCATAITLLVTVIICFAVLMIVSTTVVLVISTGPV